MSCTLHSLISALFLKHSNIKRAYGTCSCFFLGGGTYMFARFARLPAISQNECTSLVLELPWMGILSLLSGQIAYPDGRRSRHGRITEVELYTTLIFAPATIAQVINDNAKRNPNPNPKPKPNLNPYPTPNKKPQSLPSL